MPLFVAPLALIALAALPALAAIYWLRNRYRRQVVSSLILWVDQRQPREGGMRLQRVQTPLLFFLEILVLALLAMGAADPHLPLRDVRRPIVVVLDDSFSMTAGNPQSARDRAAAALLNELESSGEFSATLIAAGPEPVVLAQQLSQISLVREALDQWQPHSESSAIGRAVALATETGGPRARVLVLTDEEPDQPPQPGLVRWWAFGKPLPNIAITNAVRSAGETGDRALLEVTNLSDQPARTVLNLTGQPRQIQLDAGASQRLWIDLGTSAAPLRAQLAQDALAADNVAELLPPIARPVAMNLKLHNESIQPLLEQTLRATQQTRDAGIAPPELLVTDRPLPSIAAPESWRLRIIVEDPASSYVGPFVTDRAHPLLEGVSLDGVIWAGGESPLPGRPLVMTGDVPLLTVVDRPEGGRDITLRLRPDLSTLGSSPALPILMWNLVHWRQLHLPGPADVNLRLGAQTTITPPRGAISLRVHTPAGDTFDLPAAGEPVPLRVQQVGRYRIETIFADNATEPADADVITPTYELAVSALARGESDLRAQATGRWGDWLDEQAIRHEHQTIAWWFLLAALAVLSLHAMLVWRSAGGRL